MIGCSNSICTMTGFVGGSWAEAYEVCHICFIDAVSSQPMANDSTQIRPVSFSSRSRFGSSFIIKKRGVGVYSTNGKPALRQLCQANWRWQSLFF